MTTPQSSKCCLAGAKSTEVGVQTSSESVTEGSWPKLETCLPRLARRVQAILLLNDLVSSAGEPCSEQSEHDSSFGSSKGHVLRELHSLADASYGKSKAVSELQWIPQRKTAIAVCYSEQINFGDASDVPGDHAIVFWNLKDAFQPESVLLSPHALLAFHISPCLPNVVVGGCLSGRVVLWEQAAMPHVDGLKGQISPIPHTRLSGVEASHSLGVVSVRWLPGWTLMGGRLAKVDESQCTLFLSLAADSKLMFWDILAANIRKQPAKDQDVEEGEIQPVLTILLETSGSPLTATSLLISQLSDGMCVVLGCTDGKLAVLSHAAVESWRSTEHDLCKVAAQAHCGAVHRAEASLLLEGMLLTVADWTFAIWRQGAWEPALASPCPPAEYSAGCFSATRPAVFFMARADGVVEVWDLLEATHLPVAAVPVSAARLTSLTVAPPAAPGSNIRSLLAVGDENGVLHVLEVPRKLRKEGPKEKELVLNILQNR